MLAKSDLLSSVTGVDSHVFGGEIASPVASRSASRVQIQPNMNIFFEEPIARRALVERQGLPAAQYGNAGHVNVHSAGIELDAGAPGSGENATPVGIASGESGLDQRRSGDGLADAARVRFFLGATDIDFNHALRAFAVRDDLQRERRANLFQGSPKSTVRSAAGLDGWGAGRPIRQNQKRVVGRSVAVNADGIEGA